MARPYIAAELRRRVAAAAGERCGYCRTPQSFTAMPLHVEHIIPLAAGGSSEEDNLWLACPLCNGHKAAQVDAVDPHSGARVALYDPRRQRWADHFAWEDDGVMIAGVTACGRATIAALQLNNPHLTRARRRWVLVGWHPPAET